MLSIIIPTLNALATLRSVMRNLAERPSDSEIIVSDGFSSDATLMIAEEEGARLVESPPGRGMQLAAGAAAARGDWLLFLHADTWLAPGWSGVVADFCAGQPQRAAYFRFALDDDTATARWLEAVAAWRCRRLGLPYGNQGLLISQALYRDIGGFHALPVMADIDLVQRLGRDRLVALDHPAVASATRYRRGYLRRSLRNLGRLSLYVAGVSPARIARFHG